MVWLACLFVLIGFGCNQQPQERHYTEINSSPEDQVALESKFTWVVPNGWQEEAGDQLRLATFHLLDDTNAIDCSIVSLDGQAGGVEANLRRWMGQIHLSPTDAATLQFINSATAIKTDAHLQGKLYDFSQLQQGAEETNKSMLVAMIPTNSSTLFIKLSGTIATIKQHKSSFLNLVSSVNEKK